MKITKSQLQRIIKEELQQAMEQDAANRAGAPAWQDEVIRQAETQPPLTRAEAENTDFRGALDRGRTAYEGRPGDLQFGASPYPTDPQQLADIKTVAMRGRNLPRPYDPTADFEAGQQYTRELGDRHARAQEIKDVANYIREVDPEGGGRYRQSGPRGSRRYSSDFDPSVRDLQAQGVIFGPSPSQPQLRASVPPGYLDESLIDELTEAVLAKLMK